MPLDVQLIEYNEFARHVSLPTINCPAAVEETTKRLQEATKLVLRQKHFSREFADAMETVAAKVSAWSLSADGKRHLKDMKTCHAHVNQGVLMFYIIKNAKSLNYLHRAFSAFLDEYKAIVGKASKLVFHLYSMSTTSARSQRSNEHSTNVNTVAAVSYNPNVKEEVPNVKEAPDAKAKSVAKEGLDIEKDDA